MNSTFKVLKAVILPKLTEVVRLLSLSNDRRGIKMYKKSHSKQKVNRGSYVAQADRASTATVEDNRSFHEHYEPKRSFGFFRLVGSIVLLVFMMAVGAAFFHFWFGPILMALNPPFLPFDPSQVPW